MRCFVYSGRKKITLSIDSKNIKFFCKKDTFSSLPSQYVKISLDTFLKKHSNVFLNKKVGVIIPDNTRDFHPHIILSPLLNSLRKVAKNVDCIISLGLHRKLDDKELTNFLGKEIIRNYRVAQHSLRNVKFFRRIKGIGVYLNRGLFLYDVIFTIGVVEPHLYAGFSGGVKCIIIGLSGKKTILRTHSPTFLSQDKVAVANIKNNPFQDFLWEAARHIEVPIYSLNLVENHKKQICFFSLDEAKKSFFESVSFTKKIFGFKVRGKFDVVLVGCDYPKERSLYQASRLFNYVLDRKPIVKKGGAIFIFANLDMENKSEAEGNFEAVIKRNKLPQNYKFKREGEHRAYKVIEASRYANLAIISSSIPKDSFSPVISFYADYQSGLRWAKAKYGGRLRIAVIPFGFSFIPY
jgi:nickel-dependent lactate racemase